MVEFWIQMSSFLILLLHFTAVTGQSIPRVVVRVGDEVTLTCKNVIGNQDKCERTDWIFYDPGSSTELIKNGQIGEEAKSKSDRLSVTQNCSLVIKKVTDEDAGRYTCSQFESGHGDSHVFLSVVTMTEHENNDEVTLSCSVSGYEACYHRVEWLYEGKDKDKETSQRRCSVNLTYKKKESKKYKLFNCEVTDLYNGQVQQFPFSRQTSGDAATKSATTMAATTMAATMAATTMAATPMAATTIAATTMAPTTMAATTTAATTAATTMAATSTAATTVAATTTAATTVAATTTMAATTTAATTAGTTMAATTTAATTTAATTVAAATTTATTTTAATTSQEARADCSVLDYIMLVMRVAELLLITVITVLLIRARGNQRPPEDNTLSYSARRPRVMRSGAADSQVKTDEDEDDGVVKYEN